jgi:O-antigen ligase
VANLAPPSVRSTSAPVLVLAAVATAGIQVHGLFSFDLGISDVFLGIYLLTLLRDRRLPWCPRAVWVSIGAFVFACSIAAARAVAEGGERATWGATRLVGVLIVLAYLVLVADVARTVEARRALVRAFVVGVLAFNVLFVVPGLGHALLNPFPTGGSGRLAGGMFDQNSNATLLAAVALLALTTQAFRRTAGLVASAVGAGLLLLTYSRTGYVAFVAGLLAYLVWEGVVRRKNVRLIVTALVVVSAAAVALAASGIVQQHFAGRPDTTSTREAFVHLSLDYAKADPLFGAGFGAARHQVGFVIHSTVFALLGEGGLLALVAFLALLGIVTVRGFRVALTPAAPVDVRGLLCVGFCLFVGSFGIDGLLHRHWWIVLGLLLGASYARVERAPRRVRESVWE